MKAVVKRIRIGEALVEEGVITAEQLTEALARQKDSGNALGEVLVEQGVVSHEGAQVLASLLEAQSHGLTRSNQDVVEGRIAG